MQRLARIQQALCLTDEREAEGRKRSALKRLPDMRARCEPRKDGILAGIQPGQVDVRIAHGPWTMGPET